jgi:hypothetical protein
MIPAPVPINLRTFASPHFSHFFNGSAVMLWNTSNTAPQAEHS